MAGCPLWVISGHMQCKKVCPLYPRKRTFAAHQPMSAMGQKRKSPLFNDVGHNVLAPKIKGYAFFDIDRRNFLPLIRSSRSILTLRLVRSLVRPVANISFIGVQ